VRQIKPAPLAFGRTLIYLLTYLLTYSRNAPDITSNFNAGYSKLRSLVDSNKAEGRMRCPGPRVYHLYMRFSCLAKNERCSAAMLKAVPVYSYGSLRSVKQTGNSNNNNNNDNIYSAVRS